MKFVLEKPFSDDWKHGYLQKNREGRNIVCLVNTRKERTTIAYARYLMSVKLGRYLAKEETVDHIDNDKTNDSTDNLQLLSSLQNIQKYRDTLPETPHGTNSKYRSGCRCDLCRKWHSDYMNSYKAKHPICNKKNIDKVCEFCGKAFKVTSGHKAQRFCSNHCSMMARHRNK